MTTTPLQLCFKGQRDYLHGTDMFNAVVGQVAGDAAGFYLHIHAIARCQCDLVIADSGTEAGVPDGAVARFGWHTPQAEVSGWLQETARPVTCRIPYQEEEIEAASQRDGMRIVHYGASRYTPIEVLVALTKVLHVQALPAVAGRWMFTKIELGALPLPAQADGLSVQFLHNFSNRLTKSALWAGAVPLGHIYFSLVPA